MRLAMPIPSPDARCDKREDSIPDGFAQNRHVEALQQYRLARSVAPGHAELRQAEGVTMAALGMWTGAWERFEARLSLPGYRIGAVKPTSLADPFWCTPNRAW